MKLTNDKEIEEKIREALQAGKAVVIVRKGSKRIRPNSPNVIVIERGG